MLKKVLKLFLVIVLAWLVSLLTVMREFKNRNVVVFDENKRDHALYKYRIRYGSGNESLSRFESKLMNGGKEISASHSHYIQYYLKVVVDLYIKSESLKHYSTLLTKGDNIKNDSDCKNLTPKPKARAINMRSEAFSIIARAWDMLDTYSPTLSYEDKLAQLNGYHYPPGSNGTSVRVKDKIKGSIRMLVAKGWEDHAFNEFVSDVIPVNRSLPDVRDHRCVRKKYPKNLPAASVIICFHNEAWSTLLRTIHSVIERSPEELLNEIILIDDFSTMTHLKARLDSYVAKFPKVKLIRTERREGLIRARMIGVRRAVSEVVVFLDSHCECAEGWLEPLLDRVRFNPETVVSPLVDVILDNTFEYIAQDIFDLRIGGFTWDLKFIWIGIPDSIEAKRTEIVSPVKTPTISGGLFAINKKYFEKIGYYDEGMEIWGGDNLELSFKVWMCGGTLEMVPCSHVGHVFRKRFPYKGKNNIKRNLVRVAEVWMDDYAKYYYERINYKKGEFGDITQRQQLRKQLKCKSFDWYLKNIYPDIEVPDDLAASGKILHIGKYGHCLDAPNRIRKPQQDVQIAKCHHEGGNQYWVYAKDGELRRDDYCLDYMYNTVILFYCKRSASQIWLYDLKTQNIRHMKTQKCLTVKQYKDGLKILLQPCSPDLQQKWVLDNFHVDKLTPELQSYARQYMHL